MLHMHGSTTISSAQLPTQRVEQLHTAKPRLHNGIELAEIKQGTNLRCIEEGLEVYASCATESIISKLQVGDLVVAAGCPSIVDGFKMIPIIEPRGAVEADGVAQFSNVAQISNVALLSGSSIESPGGTSTSLKSFGESPSSGAVLVLGSQEGCDVSLAPGSTLGMGCASPLRYHEATRECRTLAESRGARGVYHASASQRLGAILSGGESPSPPRLRESSQEVVSNERGTLVEPRRSSGVRHESASRRLGDTLQRDHGRSRSPSSPRHGFVLADGDAGEGSDVELNFGMSPYENGPRRVENNHQHLSMSSQKRPVSGGRGSDELRDHVEDMRHDAQATAERNPRVEFHSHGSNDVRLESPSPQCTSRPNLPTTRLNFDCADLPGLATNTHDHQVRGVLPQNSTLACRQLPPAPWEPAAPRAAASPATRAAQSDASGKVKGLRSRLTEIRQNISELSATCDGLEQRASGLADFRSGGASGAGGNVGFAEVDALSSKAQSLASMHTQAIVEAQRLLHLDAKNPPTPDSVRYGQDTDVCRNGIAEGLAPATQAVSSATRAVAPQPCTLESKADEQADQDLSGLRNLLRELKAKSTQPPAAAVGAIAAAMSQVLSPPKISPEVAYAPAAQRFDAREVTYAPAPQRFDAEEVDLARLQEYLLQARGRPQLVPMRAPSTPPTLLSSRTRSPQSRAQQPGVGNMSVPVCDEVAVKQQLFGPRRSVMFRPYEDMQTRHVPVGSFLAVGAAGGCA